MAEKLAILRRLVDMEAQTIVSKVEDEFEDYANPEDIDSVRNTEDNRQKLISGSNNQERIDHDKTG